MPEVGRKAGRKRVGKRRKGGMDGGRQKKEREVKRGRVRERKPSPSHLACLRKKEKERAPALTPRMFAVVENAAWTDPPRFLPWWHKVT